MDFLIYTLNLSYIVMKREMLTKTLEHSQK